MTRQSHVGSGVRSALKTQTWDSLAFRQAWGSLRGGENKVECRLNSRHCARAQGYQMKAPHLCAAHSSGGEINCEINKKPIFC